MQIWSLFGLWIIYDIGFHILRILDRFWLIPLQECIVLASVIDLVLAIDCRRLNLALS